MNWQLFHTIDIGKVTLPSPVMVAPLSGVTDFPMRDMIRKFGSELVFSEMIAAKAMVQSHKPTLKMCEPVKKHLPMAVQLVGVDPAMMAQAAAMNAQRGAMMVDINMGCPVRKLITNGSGAALMRTPELAAQIVKSVRDAVDIPVTVKIRTGWDEHSKNAPDFARKMVDNGAQMVTVHGRTRVQMYQGRANLDDIAAVVAAVDVPVVGNGDVFLPKDAATMLETTGCAGVMIGRGIYGCPWLPAHCSHYLQTGELLPWPTMEQRHKMLVAHYKLILSHYDEWAGVKIARKHIGWWIKGLGSAASFRQQIFSLTDPLAVLDAIDKLFEYERKNNGEQL